MTALLVVLAVLAVVLTAVAVFRSGSLVSMTPPDGAGTGWLDRSQRLLATAAWLRTEMAALDANRSLTEFDTEELAMLSDAITAFCADAAAISSTAPTAMDGRVIRNLAVRARTLGDLLERELRRREVGLGTPRPLTAGEHSLDEHLHEFELAVDDLHTHVELL